MKHYLHIFAVGLAALALQSCATVFSGRTQAVSILSSPDSATVKVDGNILGKTPGSFQVPRGKSTLVSINREGYEEYILSLSGELSTTFWVSNGINCAVIGSGTSGSTTDTQNGSAYEFSPASYHIELKPIGGFQERPTLENGAVTRDGKLKRYILQNANQIRMEVSAGSGERIAALKELMGYPTRPTAEFIELVKPEISAAKEDNDLAERLLLLAK